jgi:hypothetical protein
MGKRDQQEDECLAPRSRRTSCDEPNLKAELSQDLAPMKRASKERGRRVSLWFSFWWGKWLALREILANLLLNYHYKTDKKHNAQCKRIAIIMLQILWTHDLQEWIPPKNKLGFISLASMSPVFVDHLVLSIHNWSWCQWTIHLDHAAVGLNLLQTSKRWVGLTTLLYLKKVHKHCCQDLQGNLISIHTCLCIETSPGSHVFTSCRWPYGFAKTVLFVKQASRDPNHCTTADYCERISWETHPWLWKVQNPKPDLCFLLELRQAIYTTLGQTGCWTNSKVLWLIILKERKHWEENNESDAG